jgi:hypothetical protein
VAPACQQNFSFTALMLSASAFLVAILDPHFSVF